MDDRQTIWTDVINPSDVLFFESVIDGLDKKYEHTITTREKAETVELVDSLGLHATNIGRDFDHPSLRKMGIPLRTLQLAVGAPAADITLSFRNAMCILASKLKRVPSIHFTDNDAFAYNSDLIIERFYNSLESRATYNIVPKSFENAVLTNHAASGETIMEYDGYKENVYVANFRPDPEFLERLPFDEFVVLRPEALNAAYVNRESSIVPQLADHLGANGTNMVYVPRRSADLDHVDSANPRIHVPSETLNGLQLCWHADCVITGSGTMAREAACMSVPAVSFFPRELLSVDRDLVQDGQILHSRSPKRIADYVASIDRQATQPDLTESQQVRRSVVTMVEEIIDEVADQ